MEGAEEYLLGEKLPEFLSVFIGLELPLLNKERVGVALCGDLYATLQKRGSMGDVKAVWRKFKAEFRWVVGVAGNHDDFGSTLAFEAFKREEGMYFLQQEIRKVDKIEFSGISGIIGRSDKPNRVEEGDYLRKLKQLLSKQPHAILLHQSPNYPPKGFMGDEKIRQLLESSPQNVIFCGHSHWPVPLVELGNGTQVLNVDSRVVILLNKEN
jgi:Icc-related predicted phosphoesterase